jgi:lipoprotein-anchoring transpeptidase ErfK/SrfK
MGPKTKVFDLWGNSVGKSQFNYAPVNAAPLPGQFFSDFYAAKPKGKTVKPKAQDSLPPELPYVKPEGAQDRVKIWKAALEQSRNNRSGSSLPPDNDPKKKKNSIIQPALWKQWYFIAFVAFLFFLAGLGSFLFLFNRSLAPVYMGNLKVSPQDSLTQIEKQIGLSTSKYAISIKDIEGKVTKFPLDKTGISIDAKQSAKQLKAEVKQSWWTRLTWWEPIRLELATKTDKDVFQNFLHTSVIKPEQPYQNASLSVEGDKVNIVKESPGLGQTQANPYIDFPAQVAKQEVAPLVLKKAPIPARIRTIDLADEKTKLENIISQKIVLKVDNINITAKPSDIASWLDLSPVEHSRTIDINVNSGKVLSYLNKIADPYIQPPRSKLVMTQTDGSVTVLDQGTNGIDIVNKDKTASNIAALVLSGKGVNQELEISYASAKTVEVQPYDKWIVVDTTNKRMYAYEQSKLVNTFLVSAGAPQTPTVTGQFAIYSKHRSQDMRGNNADGSRYFQPNVEWVSYFYKDYAVHGNYWRPLSWFGNINSSHGCVGVVNEQAQWIYDWAPIGTPVIVHR